LVRSLGVGTAPSSIPLDVVHAGEQNRLRPERSAEEVRGVFETDL